MHVTAGNVDGCSSNRTVYLNDLSVPRCSRKSWLAMTMFCIYILITSIMLINLLIAIFRLYFLSLVVFHILCVNVINIVKNVLSSELVMGWVHPWVGLGWVGSEFFNFGGLGWVGWRLDCVIFLRS